MKRTFKTFMLWLLMAVLPLNAVAAAMGMSCSAVHDRTAPKVTVHTADHQAAHAVHPAPGELSLHHEVGHAMSAQAEPAPDTGHGLAHSTCSACSAFCVGAVAPPPAVIPAAAQNASEIVLISPTPLDAGFIPDGHKRPPRHLIA